MIISNEIASVIRSRDLLALHDFQNVEAEFVEFEVRPKAPIANRAVSQIILPPQTLLAAILRQGDVVIPRGHTVLLPLDQVVVLGLKANFNDLVKLFQPDAL